MAKFQEVPSIAALVSAQPGQISLPRYTLHVARCEVGSIAFAFYRSDDLHLPASSGHLNLPSVLLVRARQGLCGTALYQDSVCNRKQGHGVQWYQRGTRRGADR